MTAEHDYNDAMREIGELRDERDRLRAAFLGYVQPTNNCSETGKPCREDRAKCGCWLEMQNWIDVGWDVDEQIARPTEGG